MKFRKMLAGICGIAMLATNCITVSAFAEETQKIQYPENVFGYLGDVKQDGAVNVQDIIALQRYLLNVDTITETQTYFADTTQDGQVNIYDLILLKKFVLSGTERAFGTLPVPPVSDEFIAPPIDKVLHNLPSQGKGDAVVFYVDFPDCQYGYLPTEEQLNQMMFGAEDETNSNYPFESVKAFYDRSSKGNFTFSGHVFRYTAKNNISYYSENRELLAEECYQAFAEKEDFTQYDGDHDGDIDVTLLSVPQQADETYWWPMAGESAYESEIVDGMRMGHLITGNAQVISETDYSNFTSSYQHELTHCMGLPDYYLYYSEDYEGFHGETNTAGVELMDTDASTDLCCFSKLMLGWYRENQISVYDTQKGGEQTFTLSNAQTNAGNCLILPYGDTDYYGEYLIVEYMTPDRNNSNAVYMPWVTAGNGIRAYHVRAELFDNGWWVDFKYSNGAESTNEDDDGIRLIRLVNDAEGGAVYTTGAVLDGNISGWHWYDGNEQESVETGYTLTVGELQNGQYTVTVNYNK